MEQEFAELLAGQGLQIEKLDRISTDVAELKADLKALNGSVRSHEVRLTVLERFCQEQVRPALSTLIDVRLELARWGMFGGGIGAVIAVVFGVGKLVGWW